MADLINNPAQPKNRLKNVGLGLGLGSSVRFQPVKDKNPQGRSTFFAEFQREIQNIQILAKSLF